MIRGRFPFGKAKRDDYWYNMISKGRKESYFARVDNDNSISHELKDLIFWMLSEKGSNRPTI